MIMMLRMKKYNEKSKILKLLSVGLRFSLVCSSSSNGKIVL